MAPTPCAWLPRRSTETVAPSVGWRWFNSEEEARDAYGLPALQRARDEQGRFLSDDPTTPDVNEAWV